jgi:uncharacterized protein YodC (DUF2158 family)
MRFETGDVVRLKSGGPPMTITEPPAPDISGYHCVWFDEHKVFHSHYFEGDALIRLSGGQHHEASNSNHIDKCV